MGLRPHRRDSRQGRAGAMPALRSNTRDRLQPRPRMDFRLRKDAGLRAEALDDAAHERRGSPARSPAPAPRRRAPPASNFSRTEIDEFGELRRLHGEAAVVALADDRFGKSLLPFGGERDDRQVAGGTGVLGAELAREPRADVLDQRRGLRVAASPSAMPSRMVARSRIETRSASRICSTRWMPETVICAGTMSLISSLCSFGSSLSSFCTSP